MTAFFKEDYNLLQYEPRTDPIDPLASQIKLFENYDFFQLRKIFALLILFLTFHQKTYRASIHGLRRIRVKIYSERQNIAKTENTNKKDVTLQEMGKTLRIENQEKY